MIRVPLRHTARAGCALALAVSGVFASAGSGSAAASVDNIVPTSTYYVGCLEGAANGTVCQTDNAALTYYMDSGGSDALEAVDKQVVRDMLSSQYGPTDLSISYDSSPTWSGGAETDIYYSEAGVPGSAEGITWCNDASPGGYKCDQQYIRIEGGGHYTPGLSCHETGHAVGLVHGDLAYPRVGMQDSVLGCMKKSVDYGQTLGSNNKRNINIVY